MSSLVSTAATCDEGQAEPASSSGGQQDEILLLSPASERPEVLPVWRSTLQFERTRARAYARGQESSQVGSA